VLKPWIKEREIINEMLGWHRGRHEGKIFGAVDILHSLGYSDKEIKKIVKKRYHLPEKEIEKYL